MKKLIDFTLLFTLSVSAFFYIANCNNPQEWGGTSEVSGDLIGNWCLDQNQNGKIDSTIDQLGYFRGYDDSLIINNKNYPMYINSFNGGKLYFTVQAIDGQIYDKYVGLESTCPDRYYRYDYTIKDKKKMYLVEDITDEATSPGKNTENVKVLLKE